EQAPFSRLPWLPPAPFGDRRQLSLSFLFFPLLLCFHAFVFSVLHPDLLVWGFSAVVAFQISKRLLFFSDLGFSSLVLLCSAWFSDFAAGRVSFEDLVLEWLLLVGGFFYSEELIRRFPLPSTVVVLGFG
ncbi:unnamed protein product, partial [Linum tenue]